MWTLLIIRLVGSLLVLFASTMLIDWFFNGSRWAHTFYAHAPNIWRPLESGDPSAVQRRIIWHAMLITIGYCLAFMLFYFLMRPGLVFASVPSRSIAIGLTLWLVVPLPLLAMQHQYVKYHRGTTLLQLASWLVKLIVAALIMSLFF